MGSMSPTDFGQRKQLALLTTFLSQAMLQRVGKGEGHDFNPHAVKWSIKDRAKTPEKRPKFHRIRAPFEEQFIIPPILNLKSPDAVQYKNFFQLFESSTMQHLTPKIEVRKVYRSVADPGEYVELPFEFPTTPKKLVPSSPNYDDEYGILGFKCNQMSYNDADVTSNIRVSVDLFFKSIASLVKDRDIKGGISSGGGKKANVASALEKILTDNLNRIVSGGGNEEERNLAKEIVAEKKAAINFEKYRISDLMVLPGTSFRDDGSSVYYAGKHDIKIIFGWSVPETVGGAPFNVVDAGTGDKIGSMREIVEAQNVALICQLMDHKITFNEDGSIKLSLEFLGRVEATIFAQGLNIFLKDRGKKAAGRRASHPPS